jgi:hypothetical protein
LGGTLAHDSSILFSLNSKLNIFLFGWHTGTHLKYILKLELKNVCLSFQVAHWNTTQVHFTDQIQNCISFFLGDTLAHHSSILYSSNSKLYIFLFGWHTGTRLKHIVRPKLKTFTLCFWVAHWHTTQVHCTGQITTASLSFWVAHWHMTQVQSTDRIQNCLSLFSGGTLVQDQIHCPARIQNCITFFSGGTRAHYSILLYLANSKLYLFVFGWHTGTQLKYIVQLEFTTASLSFQVAHSQTTQAYCTARNQNCISLFFGGTLAQDSIPLYWSNS